MLLSNDPPKDMFGKLMSIPDNLMPSYFNLLTDYLKKRLKEYYPGIHGRKLKLAWSITSFFYGEEEATHQQEEFLRVFSRRELPEYMDAYEIETLYNEGVKTITDLLVFIGAASSRSEAKRLIAGGGVQLNDTRIDDPMAPLQLTPGSVLRVGKRKFFKFV